MVTRVMQLTYEQNYFCTSRDRLRAVFSDMPVHIAFWYPISRAGVPESGADFEGLATENFHE